MTETELELLSRAKSLAFTLRRVEPDDCGNEKACGQAADVIILLIAEIYATRAARDALREALERIEDASWYYTSCTHLEPTMLAYAHESTARLARAALTGEAKP